MTGSLHTLRLPKTAPYVDLAAAYPHAFSTRRGIRTKFEKTFQTGYRISCDPGTCRIEYGTRSDLMRSLAQWLTNSPEEYSELPSMEFRGLMIDSSRNAVMRPETLRKVMLRLALFGYNALCLYTEDTYQVTGHPEIGYLRGRFTQRELRGLDRYAQKLGIEMFPCIQTLAHMEQILSHPDYAHLRDDQRILNLKVEETYSFLEDLIESASRPYTSRRIHLGLDETWGLSRGRAFIPNAPIDPREDYLNHVNWLAEFCREKDLKPMMWGDIVTGMNKIKTDAFSDQQAKRLPTDVKMVFWNYYSPDPEYYRRTIRQFRRMGFEPLVAPGLWNWVRLWGSQDITDATATHFMKVAREEGIKESLMTMWGNDGHEAPFASSYPALAQFADDCWQICGTPFDTYVLPSRLDQYPGAEKESIRFRANLSKGILWDDPLLGILARHYDGKTLEGHFAELATRINLASRGASPADRKLFTYARRLATVLTQKADLHNNARNAYLKGDTQALADISARTPRLIAAMRSLMKAHTEVWNEERKPFGLEVLQIRYGGHLVRLRQMKERLDDFVSGKTKRIDEFDEKTVRIWPSISRCRPKHGQVSTMSVIR
jgi:hypothetical protein